MTWGQRWSWHLFLGFQYSRSFSSFRTSWVNSSEFCLFSPSWSKKRPWLNIFYFLIFLLFLYTTSLSFFYKGVHSAVSSFDSISEQSDSESSSHDDASRCTCGIIIAYGGPWICELAFSLRCNSLSRLALFWYRLRSASFCKVNFILNYNSWFYMHL